MCKAPGRRLGRRPCQALETPHRRPCSRERDLKVLSCEIGPQLHKRDAEVNEVSRHQQQDELREEPHRAHEVCDRGACPVGAKEARTTGKSCTGHDVQQSSPLPPLGERATVARIRWTKEVAHAQSMRSQHQDHPQKTLASAQDLTSSTLPVLGRF